MAKEVGTVKWFKDDKGFGFIEQEGSKDIFFHFKSLVMEGYKSVKPGQRVEFTLVKSPKGFEATDVSVLRD